MLTTLLPALLALAVSHAFAEDLTVSDWSSPEFTYSDTGGMYVDFGISWYAPGGTYGASIIESDHVDGGTTGSYTNCDCNPEDDVYSGTWDFSAEPYADDGSNVYVDLTWELEYPAITLSDCVYCLACNNSTPQYVSSAIEMTYAYLNVTVQISIY